MGEFCFTVEVVQCGAAAGHGHQQRLARSAHLADRLPVAPVKSVATRRTPRARQAPRMVGAKRAKSSAVRSRSGSMVRGRPSDRRMSCWWIMPSVSAILPPKAPGQAVRFGVRPDECDDLLGRPIRVVGDTDRVDAIGGQPTLRGNGSTRPDSAEFVVAHRVYRDVADRPQLAQRRAVPLLRMSTRRGMRRTLCVRRVPSLW